MYVYRSSICNSNIKLYTLFLPNQDNLFEWHFTIRGPPGTAFDGGRFHGRIILPNDYPFKPPSIVLLTPNGRFETGKKICLSITGYHPEYWQPAWGIRTALMALISFFPTKAEGAIAGLDWTDEERKRLARDSLDWQCPVCKCRMQDCLSSDGGGDGSSAANSSSSPSSSPATAQAIAARPAAVVDLSMFKLAYEASQQPSPVSAPQAPTQFDTDATSEDAKPAVQPVDDDQMGMVDQQSTGEQIRGRQTDSSSTMLRQRSVMAATTAMSTTQSAVNSAPGTPTQTRRRTAVQLNNNQRRLMDALFAVIVSILGVMLIRRILIWLYPAYMYFNSSL